MINQIKLKVQNDGEMGRGTFGRVSFSKINNIKHWNIMGTYVVFTSSKNLTFLIL